MKSQKEYVVESVKNVLGARYDAATPCLDVLTGEELEFIKHGVGQAISQGLVEYGKDATNSKEVTSYARSMVMNHLKKAKELNGGHKPVSTTSQGRLPRASRAHGESAAEEEVPEDVPGETYKGVNLFLLPDELRAVVQTL